MAYQVIDTATHTIVATYKSRKAANTAIDRRNAKHGSYRFIVKTLWPE